MDNVISENTLIVYIDSVTDDIKSSNKQELINIINEFTIVFPIDNYINEILDSYDYKSLTRAIIEQFKLDYNRSNIIYDNEKHGMDDFLTKIEFMKTVDFVYEYKKRVKQKRYMTQFVNLYYLTLVLCTQASFYHPFKILFQLYTDIDKNIHVVNSNDKHKVIIKSSKKSIEFMINKSLNYINISNEKIMKKINVTLTFCINYEKNIEDENGAIEWKMQ